MALSFIGGIHIPDRKVSRNSEIVKMPSPSVVSIPMVPRCQPIVSIGDIVLRGQVIGTADIGHGCPAHSSVSGTVSAIEERETTNGTVEKYVVIKSDGLDTLSSYVQPYTGKISELSTDEIIDVVHRAGIVGMGGGGYPTAEKIKLSLGKATRLIVNGTESEPYITANHRLMLENPAAIINGAKILLKALGIRQGDIAVGDNKIDAANALEELISGSDLLKVRVVKTKYPQGDERQLIYALTGRELPCNKRPHDIGCVVFNVETCAAVYAAFAQGMPLVERIVTVAGDCIKKPMNVSVPIGTSHADLVEFCGGFTKAPAKIISGGPMMGTAHWDVKEPVTKSTTGVIALSAEMDDEYKNPPVCIRCGRCIRVCPMRLMPNYIALYASRRNLDEAEKYGAMSCVECGACAYICPGQVPLVGIIRAAKSQISQEEKGTTTPRTCD